jgi:hypothetical protein
MAGRLVVGPDRGPTCFIRPPRYLDVRYSGRLTGRSRSACTRFECVYSGCCRAASF